MNHNRLLLLFLAMLLMLFACSCQSTGGPSIGLVGSVEAGVPEARPALLARYDGDVFVAWADVSAKASLYWRDSEPRAYALPPRTIQGGRAVVSVPATKYEWQGAAGDPLPLVCRSRFSAEEIAMWHLVFFDPTSTAPPSAPPEDGPPEV